MSATRDKHPGPDALRITAQFALLGSIPPRLRSVSFRLAPDFSTLSSRFIFDGEPREEEKEVCRAAVAEIEAEYWSLLRESTEEFLCCPEPRKCEDHPIVVFRRCEAEWARWPSKEPIKPAQPTRGKAPRG